MSLLRFIPLCFFCVWLLPNMAAQSRLFYADNAGSESFKDIVQLSDGTILIAGTADDLNWIPATYVSIKLIFLYLSIVVLYVAFGIQLVQNLV